MIEKYFQFLQYVSQKAINPVFFFVTMWHIHFCTWNHFAKLGYLILSKEISVGVVREHP